MENNESFFSEFVAEPWSGYCKNMSRNKEWGDHLEILGLCGMLNCNIIVHQFDQSPVVVSWPEGKEITSKVVIS
jgi:hypothetical protein